MDKLTPRTVEKICNKLEIRRFVASESVSDRLLYHATWIFKYNPYITANFYVEYSSGPTYRNTGRDYEDTPEVKLYAIFNASLKSLGELAFYVEPFEHVSQEDTERRILQFIDDAKVKVLKMAAKVPRIPINPNDALIKSRVYYIHKFREDGALSQALWDLIANLEYDDYKAVRVTEDDLEKFEGTDSGVDLSFLRPQSEDEYVFIYVD